MSKTLFSTYEIGKILRLSPRTVARLIDRGRIKGSWVWGSSGLGRFVERKDLIAFLKECGAYKYVARYHPRIQEQPTYEF